MDDRTRASGRAARDLAYRSRIPPGRSVLGRCGILPAAAGAFSSPKADYNLACALGKLDDPRAGDALKAAIASGGAEVIEKARSDADFDGVRQQAWFKALVP